MGPRGLYAVLKITWRDQPEDQSRLSSLRERWNAAHVPGTFLPHLQPPGSTIPIPISGTPLSPSHPATIWKKDGNTPLTSVTTMRQCRSSPEYGDRFRRTSATIVWVCAFGKPHRALLASSSRPPARSTAQLDLRRGQTNTPCGDAASQHFQPPPGVLLLHGSSDHGNTSRPGRTRLRGCHILPIATQFAKRPGVASHKEFISVAFLIGIVGDSVRPERPQTV